MEVARVHPGTPALPGSPFPGWGQHGIPPGSPSPVFLVMMRALGRPVATRKHLPNHGLPGGLGGRGFRPHYAHPCRAPWFRTEHLESWEHPPPPGPGKGECLVMLRARLVFTLRPEAILHMTWEGVPGPRAVRVCVFTPAPSFPTPGGRTGPA